MKIHTEIQFDNECKSGFSQWPENLGEFSYCVVLDDVRIAQKEIIQTYFGFKLKKKSACWELALSKQVFFGRKAFVVQHQ